MKRCTMHVVLAGVLAVSFGCGSEDDGVPMTGLLEAYEAEVGELTALAAAHDTAVSGAADLAAMQAQETAYGTDAGGHMEEIEHAVLEMAECTHDGHGPELGDVGTALADLDAELTAHATAMAAAADVAAAGAEEARHQSAIADIAAVFDDAHDALHDEAADFMCHEHGE